MAYPGTNGSNCRCLRKLAPVAAIRACRPAAGSTPTRLLPIVVASRTLSVVARPYPFPGVDLQLPSILRAFELHCGNACTTWYANTITNRCSDTRLSSRPFGGLLPAPPLRNKRAALSPPSSLSISQVRDLVGNRLQGNPRTSRRPDSLAEVTIKRLVVGHEGSAPTRADCKVARTHAFKTGALPIKPRSF